MKERLRSLLTGSLLALLLSSDMLYQSPAMAEPVGPEEQIATETTEQELLDSLPALELDEETKAPIRENAEFFAQLNALSDQEQQALLDYANYGAAKQIVRAAAMVTAIWVILTILSVVLQHRHQTALKVVGYILFGLTVLFGALYIFAGHSIINVLDIGTEARSSYQAFRPMRWSTYRSTLPAESQAYRLVFRKSRQRGFRFT